LNTTYTLIDLSAILKVTLDEFNMDSVFCHSQQPDSKKRIHETVIAHYSYEVSRKSLMNLRLDEHFDRPLRRIIFLHLMHKTNEMMRANKLKDVVFCMPDTSLIASWTIVPIAREDV
jgi:hypothetical protein